MRQIWLSRLAPAKPTTLTTFHQGPYLFITLGWMNAYYDWDDACANEIRWVHIRIMGIRRGIYQCDQ